MNNFTSTASNLVVFLRGSLEHLEVLCVSYSILRIHKFVPVVQESMLLWIIWRKSVGTIENCRMIAEELEKLRNTESLKKQYAKDFK